MKRNATRVPRTSQSGFTLVELMVGISLGLFVLLALISATTGLLRSDTIKESRMSAEVRNLAFVVERDLARAGYHGRASTALQAGAAAYVNPFATIDTATAGCVRYTYDMNSDGTLNTAVSNDERFAIVLVSGQMYLRKNGPDYDCDIAQGTWEPLLDAELLEVTDFTVGMETQQVDVPGSARKLLTRKVTYTVTARLKKEPTRTLTHTNTLLLPNDVLS